MTVEVRAGDDPLTIVSKDGTVRVEPGPATAPDLVLSSLPEGIIGVLMGSFDEPSAVNLDVRTIGDVRQLATLRPNSASSAALGDRTRTSPRLLDSTKLSFGVLASNRPRPMIMRWSAVIANSLIRWLETKTVPPSDASALNSSRIQWMPSGSRPFVGSSKIRTGGSPRSADLGSPRSQTRSRGARTLVNSYERR